MQASQSRPGDDAIMGQRRNLATGRLLAQSKIGSIVVTVGDVLEEQSPQVSLVQRNHVVAQLSTATSDLRHPILQGHPMEVCTG
jgi:hypothetical protein